jgi:hypothetical protein
VGTKILISLAAAAAALVAIAPSVEPSHADAMPAPAQVRPLSNGDGGGP